MGSADLLRMVLSQQTFPFPTIREDIRRQEQEGRRLDQMSMLEG